MFDNIKNEEQILADMQDIARVAVNREIGSFMWDALAPAANEMAKQYIEIRGNLSKAFVQTSYGEFLDMKAEEFGLTRKQGNKATCKVVFNGLANTVIPKDFLVQTESKLRYRTIQELTIASNGSVEGYVEAEEIGTQYNVGVGTINRIPIVLTGLTSVTNTTEATSGAGIETDEELAERVLIKAKTPATSGNANHYRVWALDNSAVGDAKVYPLHKGPGTVKVIIIDINKEPANEVIVQQVADYIEQERPIGATVTVESAKALDVNINAVITKEDTASLDEIKQNFSKNLDSYIKANALKTNYVSYARIGAILLATEGVIDYSTLKINNQATNLIIPDDYVAVLGGVTIHE